MLIKNFKLVNKLPIVCFFDVYFEEIDVGIKDFKLMDNKGKFWISHPSKPYKDEKNLTKYFKFTFFKDEKSKLTFDESLLNLLKSKLYKTNIEEEIPF